MSAARIQTHPFGAKIRCQLLRLRPRPAAHDEALHRREVGFDARGQAQRRLAEMLRSRRAERGGGLTSGAERGGGLTSGGLKGRSVLTCLMRGAVRYG